MKMDEESIKISLVIKMIVVLATVIMHLYLIIKLLKGI